MSVINRGVKTLILAWIVAICRRKQLIKGRKYTSDDLMKRYDAINEFCTYFVEIYEIYIVDESI